MKGEKCVRGWDFFQQQLVTKCIHSKVAQGQPVFLFLLSDAQLGHVSLPNSKVQVGTERDQMCGN